MMGHPSAKADASPQVERFTQSPAPTRNLFRRWSQRSRRLTLGLLALACLYLLQFATWQLNDVAVAQVQSIISEPAGEIALAPLPPITLGMEGPAGTTDLGNDLLVLGHSDRILDREVGDRIQQYWPLRELLLAFNRDFRTANPPLALELAACPGLSSDNTLQPVFQSSEQPLRVCYELLQRMDDYADDLSGSLTEQHLAVLDMFYFTVARELSRLVLAASDSPEKSLKLGIQPLKPTAWAQFDGLSPESAVDQLTAQLPQHLQLQQQTAVLSGTQWLFNQGHPLLSPEKLRDWTGQLMDESNYQALICTAQKSQPQQFPFLENELPAELDLANCL